jgi:alkylation response protein AidB-like acyl-CoA dehydrogenase
MTELVAAARKLAPSIAARAEEIESGRRLPKDIADAMADAGLYGLAVPRTLGGAEAPPAAMVEILETIAQADASAAWCLMIGATTGLNAVYLPQTLARMIYGDGRTITGGVFAPMGRAIPNNSDYIVTGRWAWGSGTQNARWIVGGAMIMDGDKPKVGPDGAPYHRMMIFDAADVTFHDTWHVMGLNGTGSLDFSVQELRVPQARTVSLQHDKPREQGPLYTFPPFGLLALGIASVALGNARGALVAFRELAAVKKPSASKRTLAERAHTQLVYAEAHAAHASARAFLYDVVNTAWADAQVGREITLERRAALRLACTQATRTCSTVCRDLYDLAGGAAVYASNPLQRRFRDAHMAIQHMMVAPATLEVAGRALLGLPTDDGML